MPTTKATKNKRTKPAERKGRINNDKRRIPVTPEQRVAMAERILTETVIPLTEVPKLVPIRTSFQTVWRWTTRGSFGVLLESCKIGSKRVTSREAVARFIENQNKADVAGE